jgi:hypothetical protein
LSVTLKAHVMEQCIVPCNNKYGVGDKEESFIEMGHQIGLRENRRYQGMKKFQKKTEASLKVRTFDTHPLIALQSQKVLQSTKRTRSTAEPISKKIRKKKEGSRKK